MISRDQKTSPGNSVVPLPTNSNAAASRPASTATAASLAPVAAVATLSTSATVRCGGHHQRQNSVTAEAVAIASRVEPVGEVAAATNSLFTKGGCTGTELPARSRRHEIVDLASSLSGNPGACSSEREDVGALNPVAKATKGKAGTAVVTGHVRRSTAGTGLRVGEAVAVRPATSEFMDVTAGETAPISNSGGALGNLEPGSNTWGGGNATAPSGRADKSAKRPAAAGIPLFPFDPGMAGFNLDFEAEVSALESRWRREGIRT